MPERRDPNAATKRRAVAVGAAAAVAAVAFGLVVVLAARGGLFAPQESATSSEVLIMLVCQDESGVNGARLVMVVDTRTDDTDERAFQVVPSDLEVSLPGTSYSTLFDAYTFGGPSAVAEAYADATESGTPAYVAIPLDEAIALADGERVEVTLPDILDVFTGDELLTFGPGKTSLPWDEVDSLLDGVVYLEKDARYDIRLELSAALGALLAENSVGLEDALASGRVLADDTDRAVGAVETLAK